MKRVFALAFLGILGPAGAGSQPFRPDPQFEASMDLAAALRSKDVAKAMAAFADNAVVLPPGRDLVAGPKAIEDALKELVGKNTLTLALVSIGSTSSAELGLDAGLYEVTLKPQDGPGQKSRGKYLAVFRQDAGGRWRVTHLTWNSSEAPTTVK